MSYTKTLKMRRCGGSVVEDGWRCRQTGEKKKGSKQIKTITHLTSGGLEILFASLFTLIAASHFWFSGKGGSTLLARGRLWLRGEEGTCGFIGCLRTKAGRKVGGSEGLEGWTGVSPIKTVGPCCGLERGGVERTVLGFKIDKNSQTHGYTWLQKSQLARPSIDMGEEGVGIPQHLFVPSEIITKQYFLPHRRLRFMLAKHHAYTYFP